MITTTHQTVRVTGVTSVTVTEPEFDADLNAYVRELRVSVDEAAAPVFVLRIEGDTQQAIALTAPEQRF